MTAKRIMVVSGSVLAFLIMGALGLLFTINALLTAVDSEASDQVVTVEIPAGASTEKIASILKETGMIHNALVFRLYARFNDLDRKFIAGSYNLSPSMNLEELMALIVSGDVYRETAWFTIPEGFTIEQMAARLSRQEMADEARFLALSRQPPESITARFTFLQEIDPRKLDYILEGYLFADTYEIAAGASEEEIISLMLRRLEAVFTPAMKQRAEELGLSMHQILTLASIVEKEAGVPQDRERIAGVFLNRLELNHALQSCATIHYASGEVKEVLLYSDLSIDSPYNTYKFPGLPPGPIAAPGEAAIRAVLYPEKSDFFWFNSKGDGTGESFFARTHLEHEQNRAKMMENIRNRSLWLNLGE